MWKPKEVVHEHRWRARIVWASLLVSIAAYTIWQAWKMYDGFSNPSTSLEVTNEPYEFPYVMVCFFEGQGCGYGNEFYDECLEDALDLSTVIDHNGDERTDVIVTTEFSNCLGFDLTLLTVVDDGVSQEEAQVRIDMEWVVTDAASTEVNFYDRIQIYITTEEPTESELNFLAVPYTRWVPNDELTLPLTLAELTIGKTTKKDLNGDVITTFPPLILSSSVFEAENTLQTQATDLAYGQLNINLAQGPFSRVAVEELSPLDLGGFFGNVGGFWELLLVLWGLFFIATRDDQSPKLIARDFVKPVKEIIRRRSLSVDSGTSASQAEERPHWEPAYGGSGHRSSAAPRGRVTAAGGTAAAAGFPVMPPVNGGSSSGHRRNSSTSSRRPVVQDAPRRGSASGGGPPVSQVPTPPSYFDMTQVA